jgi:hypothetical protein
MAAGGTGNLEVQSIVSPLHINVTYANGAVTIKPTTTQVANTYVNPANNQLQSSSGQQFEFTEIHPATTSDNFADSIDNWPLTWTAPVIVGGVVTEPNIYRMQVGLSAPSALDAASPFDAIYLSMYSRTYELFVDTYVTSRDQLASPAYILNGGNVVPQIYTMFFQAGKGSGASAANARFKWLVRLANSPGVNFPTNSPTLSPLNTGAVTLSSVRVDKVDFSF